MKDGGQVGGEWLLKARGQMAEVTVTTLEAHFTVLGFTAITGEPVMCAIIFAVSELTEELQVGINIPAPMVEGDESIHGNYGSVKQYPGAQLATYVVQLFHHSHAVAPKEVSRPNS